VIAHLLQLAHTSLKAEEFLFVTFISAIISPPSNMLISVITAFNIRLSLLSIARYRFIRHADISSAFSSALFVPACSFFLPFGAFSGSLPRFFLIF